MEENKKGGGREKGRIKGYGLRNGEGGVRKEIKLVATLYTPDK